MRFLLLICAFLLPAWCALAQHPDINFKWLGVAEGLNDGTINAMVQDKQGYVWIASLSALNRFNGSQVKSYTPVFGDTTTPPNEIPWHMHCDSEGSLWIAYDNSFYEFDREHEKFIRQHSFNNTYVVQVADAPEHGLYVLTKQGLFLYHKKGKTSQRIDESIAALGGRRPTAITLQGDILLIGTSGGMVYYNTREKTSVFEAFATKPDVVVRSMFADSEHTIWIVDTKYLLYRYSPRDKAFLALPPALQAPGNTAIHLVQTDETHLFLSILLKGVFQYNLRTQEVVQIVQKDDRGQTDEIKNARALITTRDGSLFVGVADGVKYFHPKKNLFSILPVAPPGPALPIGRGMVEDRKGNLWLTSSDGISRYNPQTRKYTVWHNVAGQKDQIYYNSVRAVAEDGLVTIWIATGKGINSYTYGDKDLRFYTIKDSIPQGFYFSAGTDSKGRTWFGCRDFEGLYYYSIHDKKFHGIASHPLLHKYAGLAFRAFFEDSKGRLWFGGNQSGLVMMDEAEGTTRHWFNDNKNRNTISGNLVVDIVEDKNGIIWVSTFNGVTGIDLVHEQYIWLNNKNLLGNNNTGPLYVDKRDRLWIGAANGLYVVDAARESANLFDQQAGLLSANFTEYSSLQLANGTIMMPTTNGIACFDPEQYDPEPLQYGFSIKAITALSGQDRLEKPVSEQLDLAHNENVVEFELEAINYVNPSQTWYAFAQLSGKGDTAWQYTQNPRIIATVLPGGPFSILFKASANQTDWKVPVKQVSITVSIPIYQRLWFPFLLTGIAFAAFWILYRYRIHNVQRMQALETKAQLLEKEKALVMYENLKQHLNPHFLFNSLTSLSSLIRIDQDMAGHFLDRMSKIYRYILKNRDSETVALKEELDFVAQYIELQKTRFEEGLQVHMNIDEDDLHKRLAPVTLQNLVENAIKHNTTSKSKPLIIKMFTQNDYLVVRNNLQRKSFVETSNRQGLQSMKSLYDFMSCRPMRIEEDDRFFTVFIPLY